MRICILGPGRIGSWFAYHLGQHHNLTVIGRGQRLQAVQEAGAITVSSGSPARVAITAVARLDPAEPYDLLLVTVFAPQVAALLPELRACAARQVVIMCNCFQPADLRAAVGADSCAFALPLFAVSFTGDKLTDARTSRARRTVVSDQAVAAVFSAAGIPCDLVPDMDSWLRSHAAIAVPVLAMAARVAQQGGAGLSWAQSRQYALAVAEGAAVVRQLGIKLTPRSKAFLSRLPSTLWAAVFWGMSRTQWIQDEGQSVQGEAALLIEQMLAASSGTTPNLKAVLP